MNTSRIARRTWLPTALAVALLVGACGREDPNALLASARDYMGKNDVPAAIIQIKNALQADPDRAEARAMLGQALLLSGDPAGAETELKRALDLGVPPEEVLPSLARSQLLLGRAADVTRDLADKSLADPQAQADLQTIVARAWASQGRESERDRALSRALQAVPDYGPAVMEQARSKLTRGDVAGALAQIDGLLAKQPTLADAHEFRGDLLMRQREAKPALAAYREALKLEPGHARARAGAVRALMADQQTDAALTELAEMVKLHPGTPQTLYLQAQMALSRNEPAKAREHMQQLLRLTPDSPAALELGGAIELANNATVQAETMLARAVQLSPQLPLARRLLVSTYLRTGQVDRAIGALPPDLLKNSDDAGLLAVAGQAYMVKGDPEEAQRYLAKASQLDPNDVAKRTTLAISQLAGGETGEALASLQRLADSDTGITADLALINASLRLRKVDDALKAIDALEKKRANDPLPAHLRGRALLQRQDMAGARRAFEKALSIDPAYFASTAALAALDMNERKPEQALQRVRAVAEKNPANVQALLVQAELQNANGASPQDVAATLRRAIEAAPADRMPRLALVDHFLRRNDAKSALTEAQNAVAALPNEPSLLDALGRAQVASGDQNQALASFGKLETMMPGQPLPHLRTASVHASKQDYKAAIQSLNKALQLQPDLLIAQRSLVELAVRDNQPSLALQTARNVQKQRPKEAAGYLMEGDVHASARRWGEAATAFTAGLRAAPAPELAIKLHSVLSFDGKTAEAERVSTAWLRDNPRDTAMLMYLGDRAMTNNRLQDAQKHYDRVIALQPNNALALNNLAWVAGRLGRSDAVALAERANAAAPRQAPFIDTLAVLLSERKEHARAIELQKEAVALQPGTPLFKLNLAKIYLNAEDKAAAKPLLEELKGMGDKYGGQAEVERLLQGL
jgi:cellulose synthase operon protein C